MAINRQENNKRRTGESGIKHILNSFFGRRVINEFGAFGEMLLANLPYLSRFIDN